MEMEEFNSIWQSLDYKNANSAKNPIPCNNIMFGQRNL